MKRLIVILLIMFMVISAVACGGVSTADVDREDTAYTITKINGEADWDSIPSVSIDKVLWTEDYGIRARGQLCYDDDNLYVHLSALEKDIRAEYTEPLSPVHEDSCLEFFFMLPESDDYFNFEINPNGCLCVQFGPEKTDRINIVRDDAVDYFDIRSDRTSDGWEVFYRIPLKFIRLFYPDYHFGGEISANMYKCGDKTVNKHYLSWTQIDLDTPNFHCPEFFGKMRFDVGPINYPNSDLYYSITSNMTVKRA